MGSPHRSKNTFRGNTIQNDEGDHLCVTMDIFSDISLHHCWYRHFIYHGWSELSPGYPWI